MNLLSKAIIFSVMVNAPMLAFAQSVNANHGPVTRAEVRAELAAVERVGYQPSATDPTYPASIQAAEAKVTQQHATARAMTPADQQFGSARVPTSSND